MSYKKVGALRFVKIGRVGFSFWIARKRNANRVAHSLNMANGALAMLAIVEAFHVTGVI